MATKLEVMEIAERALDLWERRRGSEARALKDQVPSLFVKPADPEQQVLRATLSGIYVGTPVPAMDYLSEISQRLARQFFRPGRTGRDPLNDVDDMAANIAVNLWRYLPGSRGHWLTLRSAILRSIPQWSDAGLGIMHVSGNITVIPDAVVEALRAPLPDGLAGTSLFDVPGERPLERNALLKSANYYAQKAVLSTVGNGRRVGGGSRATAGAILPDPIPDDDDPEVDDPGWGDGLADDLPRPVSMGSGAEVLTGDTGYLASDRLRAETIIRGLGNPGRPLNVRLARLRPRDEEIILDLLDWNPDNQPEAQLLWDVAIGRRPGLAVHKGPLAAGEAATSREEIAHAMHRLSGLVGGGSVAFHPVSLDASRPGDEGDEEPSLLEMDLQSAFGGGNTIGSDVEGMVIDNENRAATRRVLEETVARFAVRDARILLERTRFLDEGNDAEGFVVHMLRRENPDLDQCDAEERRRLGQALRKSISVAGMRLEDALVARFRDRLLDYLAQSARRRASPPPSGGATITTMALGLHLRHLGTKPRRDANALTWAALQASLTAEDDDHTERPWSGEQDRAEQGKFITWLGKQFSNLVSAYRHRHGQDFWVD